jgi:hypothetical protein
LTKIDERKKYVVDLGGQKSTTKYNNQPKYAGATKEGKETRRFDGGKDCGGYCPRFGDDQVGRGGKTLK